MIIPVILSGGSGTRLWPLSRKEFPKQFLNIANNELSLLQETLHRIPSFCHKEPIIVCNESHRFIVAEQLRNTNIKASTIILEPEGRNTAPAIALAALHALTIHQNPKLLILSADHLIKNTDAFHNSIRDGFEACNSGYFVTFGVKPTRPETGYGYIKASNLGSSIHEIKEFTEKPNFSVAKRYFESGEYFWNSGMFMFDAQIYLDELNKFEPEVFKYCEKSYKNSQFDLDFLRVEQESFKLSSNISVDYAILERTKKACVVLLTSDWSDLGSWYSLWLEKEKTSDNNLIEGDVEIMNVSNSLIYSKERLTAVIGLKNIVVIDTDDALLISSKDDVNKTKDLVDILNKSSRSEATIHKKVHRPWGWFKSLSSYRGFQVKLLMVKPGNKLSLQKHAHRSEHWVVISGIAKVTCDSYVKELKANESTFIPVGCVHRLENCYDHNLKIIEVQTGDYLGEDDIERIEDDYLRG